MSLTTIIGEVTAQIGLPVPSSIVGNSDVSTRQLLRMATVAGKTLMKDHAWGDLITRRTFTAVAQSEQTDEPPSDFDRFYPVAHIWDESLNRPILGPLNQDEWSRITVQGLTGGDKFWTRYGGSLWIYPAPEITDEYTYSYITRNWITANGANLIGPVAAWTSDADEPRFSDDELIIQSMVWRWKQIKGLDYAEDLSTFERTKEREIARDRGPRIIDTAHAWNSYDDFIDTYWAGQVIP